ncbi:MULTISPECIES: hypothetical protein [Brucella/Ochrobactrum group]|uniref:Uncharacterized protein n=1 Tax=Brucella anthropi (strain ATCC 49188 / DSM 6882 / CCUG 24695 / JCM 21032 / LMG 3331 / NBRC 15819 / NCTC 12168 / Alc 37) TaxID=439375 RepID=A6X0Q2_BRUA4|nr:MULTISPECIES: hypothetical protein [Brucella/Ochrobactrum group]ABS14806.1 conserved hypothetical protein [Brucella anthropi ATCC 49188]AIK45330.1 hypothetical protein DR92_1582 [Brucella anthropi]KAB2739087.1 hypothetical protein F9K90_04795 [Brucella anthropi]KAB2753801.1 hypothetical protein F9K95_08295 [Brucella anthropi]KAB2762514.1 hypothetical protein F9K98_11930 [Brucella anthropi]
MITQRFLIFCFAFLATVSTASANDGSPGLPGVQAQKPIVTAPPPAPEPEQAPSGNWKNFRVGNTDVSVSGSITIDVGTKNSRTSGR